MELSNGSVTVKGTWNFSDLCFKVTGVVAVTLSFYDLKVLAALNC